MVMKKEELGKLIRARRKVLNLTIGELAEYTGLSRTTISDIELGKIHSRLDVIKNKTNVVMPNGSICLIVRMVFLHIALILFLV